MVRMLWEVAPDVAFAQSKSLRLLSSLLSDDGEGSIACVAAGASRADR